MTKSVVARESQHTFALPVHVEQNPYNKHEILIVDSGNDRFASIHKAQPHSEESAEFIVRACNAFQALIDALNDVTARLQQVDDLDVTIGEKVGAYEAIGRAKQALRLAQGDAK